MNREIGGQQSKTVYLHIQGHSAFKGSLEKCSKTLVKDQLHKCLKKFSAQAG